MWRTPERGREEREKYRILLKKKKIHTHIKLLLSSSSVFFHDIASTRGFVVTRFVYCVSVVTATVIRYRQTVIKQCRQKPITYSPPTHLRLTVGSRRLSTTLETRTFYSFFVLQFGNILQDPVQRIYCVYVYERARMYDGFNKLSVFLDGTQIAVVIVIIIKIKKNKM
jgi:hypothetical protein